MEKQKTDTETIRKQEGFEGQQSCILPKKRINFCAKHAFCKNLYITDIGYYPNAANHNRVRVKGSPQYILIHCVKGKGWYELYNKHFEVHANQYFIIPANTNHQYGANVDQPWSIYWIHFTGELSTFYFDLLMNKRTCKPENAMVNTTRQLLFYDILQHLELMNNQENIIYGNGCLYAYLSSFQTSEIKISVNENDILQHGINYMKENLNKNLRLKDLCTVLKISPAHLSALFKKKMKYSPMHLFTSFKIQKACQLLMDSNENVKTVAYSLGYEDQYHFSRVFKNMMGVAPKNFKQSGKG